jgi:ribosomal protein S18 acetylase RimI-like enzyme
MIFLEHKSEWPTVTKTYVMTGELSGFVEMYYHKYEPKFCLQNLHVLPFYRNQGIGDELLEHCRKSGIKLGFNRMFLFVENDSWQHKWYQRKGFEYHDDHDKENTIWMVKQLSD